ncbi:MAG: hypothetical protein KF830_12800 [Planctomycetes bacterium]|nr:hypothetical protein [Planctomycetota bacterium]
MDCTSFHVASLPTLLRVALLCALAGSAAAQCTLRAEALGRMPDADSTVHASALWDPDGSGPLPPLVVLGGSFQVLGDAASPGLAVYDPAMQRCSALGSGIAGPASPTPMVAAIAVLPNHDLVVAGRFTSIDGQPALNVARWNGTAWQAIGAGVAAPVYALTVLPNGDLVAGSGYDGGTAVRQWDGFAWQPVGTGLTANVKALATMPNGDLVAGGTAFAGPGHVWRWDGVAWSLVGGGTDGSVFALLAQPNGDLVAAGFFNAAGGLPAPGIARWDGAAWSSLGGGLTSSSLVWSLTRRPNGDIVAGGAFQLAGGAIVNQVAVWDGAAWSGMGSGLGKPWPNDEQVATVLALDDIEVIAGGNFLAPDGTADRIARWDGTGWRPLATGTGGSVLAAAEAANGDRIVVGDFLVIEGVPARRVARRTGGTWQALGSGLDGGTAQAVLGLPNGDIVVGGSFSSAGGVAANRVARWDGTSWHALGAGLPGTVQALAFHQPTGQILAAGVFLDRFVVWDGQAWHGTGVPLPTLSATRRNFLTTPDGEVLAAIDPSVRRWTGAGWQPVTAAGQAVNGLLAGLPDGGFAVATGSAVRRWTGAWTGLPGTPFQIGAIAALPNGDLLVGATTTAPQVPGSRLARWNGAWQVLGAPTIGTVTQLRWLESGSVLATGTFTRLLDVAASGYGEILTTCTAGVAPVGAGCTGSGGLNQLAATSLPWLGGTYTSLATGMPAFGLAAEVFGLGAVSVPLDTLLAQAVSGCLLTTSLDLHLLHVPTAGELRLALPLPSTPTLLGTSWWQQVVPFDLDAQGGITAITATNSLQLSFGAF